MIFVLVVAVAANTRAASGGGSAAAAANAVTEDPGGAGVGVVKTTTCPVAPVVLCCDNGRMVEAIGVGMRMLRGMASTKSFRPRRKRG